MLAFPWQNRLPIEPVAAQRVLREELPALDVRNVRPLAEGWDFVALLVDDAWVFRFPKRRSCARTLLREVRLLDALEDTLDRRSIALPHYRFVVERPRAWPVAFAGYAYLPGTPLIEHVADDLALEPICTELGVFLKELHGSRPAPPPRRYRDEFPSFLPDFRQQLEALAPALPDAVVQSARRLLARPLAEYTDEPVFQHADLGMEHLLAREPGRADPGLAIIDWGDAGWGDPWGDFVGLWAWAGDRAVHHALHTYGREPRAGDWIRMRHRGACVAIAYAYYGHFDRRPGLFAQGTRMLERMHRDGQLDDPATEAHA